MAGSSPPKARLLVVGANHRSSSLTLRDRLFVEDAQVPAFLARLKEAGIGDALVLATCDRVEVQAMVGAATGADGAGRITGVIAAHAGLEPRDLAEQLYVFEEADAVRHVFAVAASLDSLVIGEPQVAGQVKAGHRMARHAGMVGADLEAVLQAAYGAAKRVRRETAIGERPVSLAAAAVELARDLHGDLARCTGLLIGAGDMGELVAEHMHTAGLGQLTVVHSREAQAQAQARRLGCHWAGFEALASMLAEADIVLSAVGARRHTLSADMVRGALGRRRHKPVFLVDVAVPGDIEPAVNRIDEAFLYDLADLEQVSRAGRANREAEARSAWEIIDAAVAEFLRGQAEREGIPTLSRLRRHFEDMREDVLAEAGGDAEKATRLLINRLLHDPSEAIRAWGAGGNAGGAANRETAERILKNLFRLDQDDEE